MATQPVFVGTPKNGKVQIANADASNQKTVVTAASGGSKVVSLNAVSTDTSARDVQVSITNGGTSYPIGTLAVPIGAGNTGTVISVNMLNPQYITGLPLDADGNQYILLVSGDTLTVAAQTTVTTAKLITVVAIYGDF